MTEQQTPSDIVKELDKYIIGQQEAKRHVAIALRNRWRRMHAPQEMQKEIIPNNILMIGPTGVGKTEIARRLAKLADAPFVKVEASKFTEVGYVGRDVESMVRDLVEQAVHMVRQSKKAMLKQEVEPLVTDMILDLLIPSIKPSLEVKPAKITINGKDVPLLESDRVQNDRNHEVELNQKTREKFREKLLKGELEDRKIEIEVPVSTQANVGVIGPNGLDDASLQNLQELLSGMLPKKNKKRKVTIAEARKILLDEELAKRIDMDDVRNEAVKKAENTGIIFIDEIDKIARSGVNKASGADVSREGVQRDLLPIVEGSAINTKYGVVHTDYILFIAAGAFHFSKPSDLIPELQGRFPIRVELNSLTKEDFVKILKTPKNSLTKQYQALLQAENVQLQFEDDAIEKISEYAGLLNEELENIGARRLHTVMSTLLNQIMFEVPDVIVQGTTLKVTAAMVDDKLRHLVKNRDLSQFIL